MPAEPPPHGLGKRTVRKYRWSFVEWARQSHIVEAWKELAEKHGLRSGEWQDAGAIFRRADVGTSAHDVKLYSMMKAKKYGWFGFVDSFESMLGVIDDFVMLKIIPDPKIIEPESH